MLKQLFALNFFVGTLLPIPMVRAQEITVYTAIESDDLQKYKSAFEQDHPQITINWVRNSTGVVTSKILAERDNPQADAVWGLAATSLMILKEYNLLEPYAPKGIEMLDPQFRDHATPPQWAGMNAWVSALCFNTVEAKSKGLPVPVSWKDLTKPVYKGHIVMPNPASSGTGFLDVSAWLQLYGNQEGWTYMEKLHENIASYTHSGSKPCKLAATGEAAIGISFAFRAAKLKAQGAPIEIIIPEDGIGWEMEAMGIIKKTSHDSKKLAAVKTLMDWAVSRKANEMYSQSYAVVAYPGVAKPLEGYPESIKERMIKNDFVWAATNRDMILADWQKRFSNKQTL